jgi:hypothetical protein
VTTSTPPSGWTHSIIDHGKSPIKIRLYFFRVPHQFENPLAGQSAQYKVWYFDSGFPQIILIFLPFFVVSAGESACQAGFALFALGPAAFRAILAADTCQARAHCEK